MPCPNCGAYIGNCYCTWDQQQKAREILRREREEFLRSIGRPTVIDRTHGKGRKVATLPRTE